MSNLWRLTRFLKPYRRQAFWALVTLVAAAFAELAIPRLMQRTVDQGILRMDMPVILQTMFIMLGFALASAILMIINSITSVRASQGFGTDVRGALFRTIQSLSFANIDRFQTGNLLVRMTSDIMQVQMIVQMAFRMFVRAPVTILVSVIMLITTSPRLALIMLAILPVMTLVIILITRKAEPLFLSVQRKLDRLNSIFQENLAGVRVVKAFVREGHEAQRLEVANTDLMVTNIRVQRLLAILMPSLLLITNLCTVIVLWMGARQMDQPQPGITVGQVMAFVNYLMTIMFPLTMLATMFNRIAAAEASAKRIWEVLDTVPAVQNPPMPKALPEPRGLVRFEDVSFRYGSDHSEPVLQDIHLTAEPGQTVAILGATGTGKSSLVHLIPRFYDVTEGRVTVDGLDVRELDLGELRRRIVSIALQDTVLFTGTIRDNIRYGRPDATDEEVIAAAKAAQAHDFIMSFPDGYDTLVGQRGVNLSGGQKQRIAIARALVMNPAVLILDDSTSSVDVETEAKIQEALEASRRKSTRFIIAQRISSVLTADKIVVLDGGRVAAEGTHAELMASSPLYREIYESQLGNGGISHG